MRKISPKDAFPGARYRRVSSGRGTGKDLMTYASHGSTGAIQWISTLRKDCLGRTRLLFPGAERRTGQHDSWMDREMRTTFEGLVATDFLVGETLMRNRGSGLREDELVTAVMLFVISCINAVASLVACCTNAFASFPSGQKYF